MFPANRTSAHSKSSRRISRRPTPAIEPLEGRLLLATYYVATNGLDTNNGTSLTTPFANLQTAVNRTVAGDTVYVRGGTYRQGSGTSVGGGLKEGVRISATHGGTSGNYMTISAYNGETPIFKATDVIAGWTPTTVHGGTVNAWYVPWSINSQQVFVNGAPLEQIGMPSSYYTTATYPNPVGGVNGNQDSMTTNPTNPYFAGQFYYNSAQQRLYITANPTGKTVEVPTRLRTFFSDASYVKLVGLTFVGSSYSTIAEQGAAVYPGSNGWVENCTIQFADDIGINAPLNTVIRNSRILDSGEMGIGGSGNNFLVQNNLISGNNYRGFGTQWAGSGMKFMPDYYGIIENNEVSGNFGSGIWADTNKNLGSNLIIIRNNYIHDNRPGLDEAGIFFENSVNGLIYNNVIVNSNRRGIYVSGSANVKIYNNTIVGQQGIAAIDVLTRNGVNSTNVLLRNNTFTGSTSTYDVRIGSGTTGSSDYNNFYRSGTTLSMSGPSGTSTTLAAWRSATGWDTHSLNVAPGFVASGSGAPYYQLASTSPLINKGTTLSEVPKDYAGTARPYGSAYDIGAYEYFPVDSIAPTVSSVQIGEGTVQRSIVQKATVVFSEKVNLNSGLNVRTGDGAVIANVTVAAANPSADMKTWVLTFSGAAVVNGSLPDGVYQVLATTAVKDLAGNSLASNYTSAKFHRLYGDSDGNASVDALDLYRFRQCYLKSSGSSAFNALFDSDGNGSIDTLDLFRFRNNYLKSYSY